MQDVTKMVPFLWEVLGKNKKGAVNVTTKDDVIEVSIMRGRRWKRFKGDSASALISNIRQYAGISG